MGYAKTGVEPWSLSNWTPPPSRQWYDMERCQLRSLLFVRDILSPEQHREGYLTVVEKGIRIEDKGQLRVFDIPIAHTTRFPSHPSDHLYHIPIRTTPSLDNEVWQTIALFERWRTGFRRFLIYGGNRDRRDDQHIVDVQRLDRWQFGAEMPPWYVATRQTLARNGPQGATAVQHLEHLAALYAPK